MAGRNSCSLGVAHITVALDASAIVVSTESSDCPGTKAVDTERPADPEARELAIPAPVLLVRGSEAQGARGAEYPSRLRPGTLVATGTTCGARGAGERPWKTTGLTRTGAIWRPGKGSGERWLAGSAEPGCAPRKPSLRATPSARPSLAHSAPLTGAFAAAHFQNRLRIGRLQHRLPDGPFTLTRFRRGACRLDRLGESLARSQNWSSSCLPMD